MYVKIIKNDLNEGFSFINNEYYKVSKDFVEEEFKKHIPNILTTDKISLTCSIFKQLVIYLKDKFSDIINIPIFEKIHQYLTELIISKGEKFLKKISKIKSTKVETVKNESIIPQVSTMSLTSIKVLLTGLICTATAVISMYGEYYSRLKALAETRIKTFIQNTVTSSVKEIVKVLSKKLGISEKDTVVNISTKDPYNIKFSMTPYYDGLKHDDQEQVNNLFIETTEELLVQKLKGKTFKLKEEEDNLLYKLLGIINQLKAIIKVKIHIKDVIKNIQDRTSNDGLYCVSVVTDIEENIINKAVIATKSKLDKVFVSVVNGMLGNKAVYKI